MLRRYDGQAHRGTLPRWHGRVMGETGWLAVKQEPALRATVIAAARTR